MQKRLKNTYKKLTARVDDDLHERATAFHTAHGITQSEFVIAAVERFMLRYDLGSPDEQEFLDRLLRFYRQATEADRDQILSYAESLKARQRQATMRILRESSPEEVELLIQEAQQRKENVS